MTTNIVSPLVVLSQVRATVFSGYLRTLKLELVGNREWPGWDLSHFVAGSPDKRDKYSRAKQDVFGIPRGIGPLAGM